MKVIKKEVEQILNELQQETNSNRKKLSEEQGLDYMDMLLSLYIREGIKDIKGWENQELDRQNNKSLSNQIGAFHERMVASFPGWKRVKDFKKEDPKRYKKYKGLDVIHEKKKISCEIKNKHNTVNSNSLKQIARTLNEFKRKNKWKDVYLVIMLPKCSSDLALKGKEKKSIEIDGKNIEINYRSGRKLYEIITGDKFFYRKLITRIFPEVLKLSQTDTEKIKKFYDDIYDKK